MSEFNHTEREEFEECFPAPRNSEFVDGKYRSAYPFSMIAADACIVQNERWHVWNVAKEHQQQRITSLEQQLATANTLLVNADRSAISFFNLAHEYKDKLNNSERQNRELREAVLIWCREETIKDSVDDYFENDDEAIAWFIDYCSGLDKALGQGG